MKFKALLITSFVGASILGALYSIFLFPKMLEAAEQKPSVEQLLPALPSAYVVDEANLLSDEAETAINGKLAQLEADTSTEMLVVLLPQLYGIPIEEWGLTLGRSWGVGQKEFDNGLIFIVGFEERKTRIEVGRGLEGAITDLQAGMILDEITAPYFRAEDYEAGVDATVSALDTLARGEVFDLSSLQYQQPFWITLLILLPWVMLPIWALLSWFSETKSWWMGGIFGGLGSGALALIAQAPGLGFWALGGALLGLLLDFLVSTFLHKKLGGVAVNWSGGGWSSGSGSSGSSFGGGSFGGGGSSSSW